MTILCGEGRPAGVSRGSAGSPTAGPFASPLLAACNEVEQMGGTADGLILNPVDYYRLLGAGRLVDVLEGNGVFVVRTRLVEPGTALVGDFGHGAQLFDAGRSTIRFAEPPPGTFAEPGPAVMARIHERVVVNLPTNFFLRDASQCPPTRRCWSSAAGWPACSAPTTCAGAGSAWPCWSAARSAGRSPARPATPASSAPTARPRWPGPRCGRPGSAAGAGCAGCTGRPARCRSGRAGTATCCPGCGTSAGPATSGPRPPASGCWSG